MIISAARAPKKVRLLLRTTRFFSVPSGSDWPDKSDSSVTSSEVDPWFCGSASSSSGPPPSNVDPINPNTESVQVPQPLTFNADGSLSDASQALTDHLAHVAKAAADTEAHGVLWAPVDATQNLLGMLHLYGDWVVVALTVPWLLKVFQLPLTIYAQRKIYREEPHVQETLKTIQEYQERFSHDNERLRAEVGALIKKRGNPVKAQFLPVLAQLSLLPVQCSLFLAFRTMHERFPSWHFEGWWWFQDLSLADPTYVLPLSVGFLTAGHIIGISSGIPDKQFAMNLRLFGMVGAGVSIPMMYVFGTGFNVYCLSNLLANMLQSAVLRNPDFRKRMKLKPNPVVERTEDEKVQDRIMRIALGWQLIAVGLMLYVAKDLFTPQAKNAPIFTAKEEVDREYA